MSIRKTKTRVRDPFPVPPTPAIYKKIAYSFVALTILIVFAALWFSSVRATVTLTLNRESSVVETNVVIAKESTQDQLAGRVIQGVFEKVKEFEVSGGNGRTVEGTATGRVKIINTYSREQPLVATTRLLTKDGRLYRIKDAVTVPANGSVEVEAYADEDGGAYDGTSKITFTIPGLSEAMQKVVYAESISPFTGGSSVVRLLTNQDIEAATVSLREELVAEAQTTLRANVPQTDYSDSVFLAELIESRTSVPVGEEATNFLLSMKLNVTGVFYSKGDMESLVRSKMKDRVPDEREIVSDAPTKLTFSVLSVSTVPETATVQVEAEVLTKRTNVDGLVSKEPILGLPIIDAEHELERMQGIESATITVRPNWVRRLPTLKDHISFKVQ